MTSRAVAVPIPPQGTQAIIDLFGQMKTMSSTLNISTLDDSTKAKIGGLLKEIGTTLKSTSQYLVFRKDQLKHVVFDLKKIVEDLEKKDAQGLEQAITYINLAGFLKSSTPGTPSHKDQILHDIGLFLSRIHPQVDRSNPLKSTSATPDEKLRAAQRFLVFHVFNGIDNANKLEDQRALNEYLDILEKLTLDPKDLPEGVTNLAHQLFGKLYVYYKEDAELEGSSLKHPHDPAYKSDFGRNAFRGDVDASSAVDRDYLQDAIRDVKIEVFAKWQMPHLTAL